jgi:amino acid transporter
MGPVGALLLTAGVIASVGANLVGSMFALPRITYRLALDGHLPRWFGMVHPTYNTPIASIIFYGTAAFLLAATGSFVWLAGLSVVTRVPLYLCCIGAIPRLKARLGNSPQALRLPGGYTVPVLAVIVCVGLLTQVKASAYWNGAAFLAVGSILYVAARRSKAKTLGDAAIDGRASPLGPRNPD